MRKIKEIEIKKIKKKKVTYNRIVEKMDDNRSN